MTFWVYFYFPSLSIARGQPTCNNFTVCVHVIFLERFHPLFLTIYHNRPLHRKEQRGREMHKLF